MIQHRLEGDDIISYHSAYRTIAVNVFGPGLNNVHVLFEDGKAFKETDLLQSSNLYFLWLLTDFIPFANSLQKPWMITNGDAFLLDKIAFSEQELRVLREKGLLIFMYEPLFLLNKDRSWPWVSGGDAPLFVELDEIDRLRERLQIPVRVLLCELDMPEYLRAHNLYPQIQFHGFSSLLMHEATYRRSLPWPATSPEKLEKHLISLNFRYESIREMLVGFLFGQGHSDKCYVSFYHEHDYREFKKRLPFSPQRLAQWNSIDDGIRKMQPFLPLTLDASNSTRKHPVASGIPDINGSDNIRNFSLIKDYMSRSFAFAYCESRPFSPRSEISEKTLDALQAMKPFVVFAAPHFYRKLRELGFKTFSKYWSEDFDGIEDPLERYEAFLKTVDFICSQDMNTLRAWTVEMRDVVEHNRLLFIRQLLPQLMNSLRQELHVN